MKNALLVSFAALLFLGTSDVFAQERDEDGYNDFSVRPVHEWDQFHKRTLWWRIYGDEKMNKPLFAVNNEISKVIIEAVKSGILRPFENDSLKTRMSYESFMENLKMPGAEETMTDEEKAMFGSGEDDGWGGDSGGGGGGWGDEFADKKEDGAKADASANEYLPRQIRILEMREDMIFDKRHSRIVHDIQAISLILSAKLTPTGLEKTIASFSYKELVENVFKDNPYAIWYNNNNIKEHRNLSEAFDLRLFAAHLVKYANSDDNDVEAIYGTDMGAGNPARAAIVASQQIEQALVEWEDVLWEY